MTSTVTINAHPAPPNNVVEMELYSDSDPTKIQRFVLVDGARHIANISGDEGITIRETFVTVVQAYENPPPAVLDAPTDEPTATDMAPSTTG